MTVGTLALAAFAGSVISFAAAIHLRRLRVTEQSPAGPTAMSARQKQKRVTLASWLAFAVGAWLLGAAVFFEAVTLHH